MSLIEEASKRLEELKRSGVHVPDGIADLSRRADDSTTGRHEPVSEFRVAPSPLAKPTPQTGRSAGVSKRVAIDLPTLAAHGYVAPDMPHSPVAQEFRIIKRPLIANVQGKSGVSPNNANLVMVTSAVAGEGKSFCAFNLAMSIAMEFDSTVLLVDADVARPSLLRMLRLPDSRGLLDVLTRDDADLSEVILRTNVEKLSLLPAGSSARAGDRTPCERRDESARRRTGHPIPGPDRRVRLAPSAVDHRVARRWRRTWGRSSWWSRRSGHR